MRKILFTANTMTVGGIERALINILKNIDYKKYEVTLILQEKNGLFLDEIPKEVNVIEYKISTCKIKIFRKIYNRLKMIFTCIKYHNKYDFSACFATYSIPSSILARNLSKNNAIWIHNDYYYVFNQDKDKICNFMNSIGVDKFKRIIFVANESKDHFLSIYGNLKNNCFVCNNLVDYKKIKELSTEIIEEDSKKTIFLNVSRHDEEQKKLTRLIEASKMLKDDGYDFEVWMIGDGPDTQKYTKMINDLNMNDVIKLLGSKKNPYPYYKKASAFVMTSDYEGFPVVYVESCIFNLPIITTINVTDEYLNVGKTYGILVQMDSKSVYLGMKKFITEGFDVKEKFDPEKFNSIILDKIYKYFENK